MGNFRKSIVAIALISGLGIATLCTQANAQTAAPSSEQIDSTLQTFKNMPAAEREALLKQAMKNLQNMSPEERAQLMEVAKARAQAMSGSQLSNYESQYGSVLTPEQKQKVMQQMQANIPQAAAPAAPPQQNTAGNVMQQIKTLSPAEKQKLMDELKASAAAPK